MVSLQMARALTLPSVTISLTLPRVRSNNELESYRTSLENAGLWAPSEIEDQYQRLKRAESEYEKPPTIWNRFFAKWPLCTAEILQSQLRIILRKFRGVFLRQERRNLLLSHIPIHTTSNLWAIFRHPLYLKR